MTPSPSWEKGQPPGRPSEGSAEVAEDEEVDEGEIVSPISEEQERLRRHLWVLKVLMENEPVGIIRLSDLTELPHHKVRYSLRVLEQEGLVEPSAMGARSTPAVEEFLPKLAALIDSMQQTLDELREAVRAAR